MSKRRKENKNTNYNVNVKVSSVTWAMVAIGLALILASHIQYGDFELKQWVVVGKEILNTLGTTLLSAGLVSVIVEISTIRNIVDKALEDVLNADFPLESYSNEMKEKLGYELARSRCKNEITNEAFKNSIYKMENRLIEYADGLYYEYHNAHYVITPNDDDGTFNKRVFVEYKVINKYNLENNISFSICMFDYKANMTDDERKAAFKIHKFVINDTDLTNEAEEYKSIEKIQKKAHSTYTYRLLFKRELQKCKEHKVIFEYEYNIPQSDVTQTYKISTPCKRLSHEILINDKDVTSKWRITPNAFTSFFCNQQDSNGGFAVIQTIDNSARIEFDNWVIPGAGYVILYTKE